MPELTKRLRASIVEWEKEKKPILVDGTPYLVLMQRQEEEYLADKKARREQRQRKRKGGGSSAGGSIGGSLSIARKRGKENAVRHR